jgi:hypothetical protein
VVTKVTHRMSVSKPAVNNFYMDRFNFQSPNDVEIKEQYQVKISNRFAALEGLDMYRSIWFGKMH